MNGQIKTWVLVVLACCGLGLSSELGAQGAIIASETFDAAWGTPAPLAGTSALNFVTVTNSAGVALGAVGGESAFDGNQRYGTFTANHAQAYSENNCTGCPGSRNLSPCGNTVQIRQGATGRSFGMRFARGNAADGPRVLAIESGNIVTTGYANITVEFRTAMFGQCTAGLGELDSIVFEYSIDGGTTWCHNATSIRGSGASSGSTWAFNSAAYNITNVSTPTCGGTAATQHFQARADLNDQATDPTRLRVQLPATASNINNLKIRIRLRGHRNYGGSSGFRHLLIDDVIVRGVCNQGTFTLSPNSLPSLTLPGVAATYQGVNGLSGSANNTVNICPNQPYSLSFATALTPSPTTYAWSFPNSATGTGATTTLPAITGTAIISISVTGGCVGDGGAVFDFTVAPTAPVPSNISITPASAAGCPGTTVTLTGGADCGPSTCAYSWNPGPATANINYTYPPNTTGADANVRSPALTAVRQDNGCVATTDIGLTVYVPAVASITFAPTLVSSSYCSGTTFTATGGPVGSSTYLWATGETTRQLMNLPATNTTNAPTNRTLTVTVTTGNSCTATATRTITINPRPRYNSGTGGWPFGYPSDSTFLSAVPPLAVDDLTQICSNNNSYRISGLCNEGCGTAVTYTWDYYNANNTTSRQTGGTATIATVGNAASMYNNVTPSFGASTASNLVIGVCITMTNSYGCSFIDGACDTDLTDPADNYNKFRIYRAPTLTAPGTTPQACEGDDVSIAIGAACSSCPTLSYNWSPAVTGTGTSVTVSGLSAGTYNYGVTASAAYTTPVPNITCQATLAIPVTVLALPVPTIGVTPAVTGSICGGATLNLDAGLSGAAYTYFWDNGETTQGTSYQFAAPASQVTSTVAVTVTESGLCSGVATRDFVVNAAPGVGLNLSRVCNDGSTSILGNTTNTTTPSYSWAVGTLAGVSLSGGLTGSSIDLNVAPSVTGFYGVTLTVNEPTLSGCPGVVQRQLEIVDCPNRRIDVVVNAKTDYCVNDVIGLRAAGLNPDEFIIWPDGDTTSSSTIYSYAVSSADAPSTDIQATVVRNSFVWECAASYTQTGGGGGSTTISGTYRWQPGTTAGQFRYGTANYTADHPVTITGSPRYGNEPCGAGFVSNIYNCSRIGAGIPISTTINGATVTSNVSNCLLLFDLVPVSTINTSITVSVPNVNLGAVFDTVCVNDPLVITADCPNCVTTGTISYAWSNTASTTSPPSNLNNTFCISCTSPLNLNLLGSTGIGVTVTDGAGCVGTANKEVFVRPNPLVRMEWGALGNTTSPASYCPVSSVALNVVNLPGENCSGCSYLWNTGQRTSSITVNQAQNFVVTVQGANTCQTRLSIDAQPYTPTIPGIYLMDPDPLVAPTLVTNSTIFLCNTQVLELSAAPNNCPTCNYRWSTNSTTPAITVSSQGGYFLEVVDENGCTGYSQPLLVVNSSVGSNVSVSANASAICNSEPVVLSATPCVGCQYRWFNTASTTALGAFSPNNQRTITTSGTYYAEVRNSTGCLYVTNSLSIGTGIAPIPPVSFSPNDTICTGSQVVMSTPNLAGHTYQWYEETGSGLGFIALTSATGASFTTGNPGTYRVEVTYPNGCSANSVDLEIVNQIVSPISITATSGTTSVNSLAANPVIYMCQGNNVEFAATVNPSWSYQWYRDGLAISGATASGYITSTPGNYYLNVINSFGCNVSSSVIRVLNSTLVSATASTNQSVLCANDSAVLSVSFCANCQYVWLDQSTLQPLPVYDPVVSATVPMTPNVQNYTARVGSTGVYYAVVNNPIEGCSIASNFVTISAPNTSVPTINASRPYVCNSVTSNLFTTPCVDCEYTWERYDAGLSTFVAIPGALNLPNYSTLVEGVFRVMITYPNGCRLPSSGVTITDRNITTTITPLQTTICGTGSVRINTTPDIDLSNCATGCRREWYYNNTFLQDNFSDSLRVFQPGSYRIIVRNSDGCQAESNVVQISQQTLNPILSSSSTAICGAGRWVILDVTLIPNVEYTWRNGSSNIPGLVGVSQTSHTVTTIGNYNVSVVDVNTGCSALSNSIPLNILPLLDDSIRADRPAICAGDSVPLRRVSGACTNCAFQWYRSNSVASLGSPVPAATAAILLADQEGFYRMEMRDLVTNCTDTSNQLYISSVPSPPGFALNLLAFPPINQLPVTGNPVNLYNYLTGAGPWSTGRFTSRAFNALLPTDQGLSGVDSSIFTPADAQMGFHRIAYRWDTLGCTFITSDTNIIRVLDEAVVNVFNLNPSHVPYEACVGDTLILRYESMVYIPTVVEVFNTQNVYAPVTLVSATNTPRILGGNTIHDGELRFVVSSSNRSSSFRVTDGAAQVRNVPFVLIHNESLSFAGLPALGCSNGAPINLAPTPTGGIFRTTYLPITTGLETNAPGLIAGNSLNTANIPRNQYDSVGRRRVRVIYEYPGFYTNGNSCPQPDTVSMVLEVRSVFLDSFRFSSISASQDQELLTNLVRRTWPYSAAPNRWLLNPIAATNRSFSFSGSFTTPAGDPLNFLPRNAGVGAHPITYTIRDSSCVASRTDTIQVFSAPNAIGLQPQMCWNNPTVGFTRQTPTFNLSPRFQAIQAGFELRDTTNLIRVTSSGTNARLTFGGTTGSETFGFTPSASAINQVILPGYPVGRDTFYYDTVLVEYIYRRIEFDNSTVPPTPIDTIEFVRASIYQPIMIEDTFSVELDRSTLQRVYCEDNHVYLLSGKPVGGYFTLEGGTGPFVTAQTLVNGLFNPFAVHQNETTDTYYNLSYVVDGVVCQNRDTMTIMVAEPANPSFVTVSGDSVYCAGETPDTIRLFTNPARDISTWLIGGIAQPAAPFLVDPRILSPGFHVGTHEVTNILEFMGDTTICVVSASDTFLVNALPTPQFVNAMNPALPAFPNTEFCTNDPILNFVVSPPPTCNVPPNAGILTFDQDFEGMNPFTGWGVFNISGKPWTVSNNFAYSGSFCAAVDSSDRSENSWLITPNIAMTAGRIYRISYFVRTSELFVNPACGAACDDASLRVTIGQGLTPAAHATGTLAVFSNLTNQVYEQRFHDFLCTTTGNYNFGFQVFSGNRFSRWLRLDNIEVRDISGSGCSGGGIGNLLGMGTSNLQDSLYAFNPAMLSPGNARIRYSYTDANGCTDSVVQNLLIKPHPQVSFTNVATYCANEPGFNIVGSPAGGNFSATRLTGTGTSNLNAAAGTYLPRTPGQEQITYTYQDPQTFCQSFSQDTATVLAIEDSARILLPLTICANAGLQNVIIDGFFGTPGVGTLTGPGLVNAPQAAAGGAQFDPALAVSSTGRYGDFLLEYVYPTTQGQCLDTNRLTIRVEANPQLSFVNFRDSICANEPNIQLQLSNRYYFGTNGQIIVDSLLPLSATITAFTGTGVSPGGNLTPSPANIGTHPVTAVFTEPTTGCASTITRNYRVDTIPVITFNNLPASRFLCENDNPILLLANPPYYPGSGFLRLNGTRIDSSFYRIEPAVWANAPLNQDINIEYHFRDLRGCANVGFDTLTIRPYPRVSLTNLQTVFCNADSGFYNLMPGANPQGGRFVDDLPLTAIFQDSLLILDQTGPRRVTYIYTDSITTCSSDADTVISVFNTPIVDFDIIGGCATARVAFVPDNGNLVPGLDSVTNVRWIFGDGTTTTLGALTTTPTQVPDTAHTYTADGNYTVRLEVTNQGLCASVVEKNWIISPKLTYNRTQPYFQNFENGPGGWHAEQPITPANTGYNIWSHGLLTGNTLNDPANRAWSTLAAAPYTYERGQTGWVYMPCFDFSTAWKPMIVMDQWRDFTKGIDGAVMEYFDEAANAWKVFGQAYHGIQWYDGDFLLSRPGAQQNVPLPLGWTGESDNWVNTRYSLDQFAGQDNVRLRIAFASAPNTVLVGREGMAFDNVWIGERGRNVLVEHFTHVDMQDADIVDGHVYDILFTPYLGRDAHLIQYHTAVTNELDPFNQPNTEDPSARGFQYGISEDGMIRVAGKLQGSGYSQDLTQFDIQANMLLDPKFEINIQSFSIIGSSVSVESSVRALESMDSAGYAVFTAIVEDSLFFQATPFTVLSKQAVLRKLVPDASGQPFGSPWAAGRTENISHTWNMFGGINPLRLQALVFIQNMDNQEVYQVATTRDLTVFAPTANETVEGQTTQRETMNLTLFPNPASSYFNVRFDQPLEGEYEWGLIDLHGRLLRQGQVQAGTDLIQVATEDLSASMYIFYIRNDKVHTQRQVIITRP